MSSSTSANLPYSGSAQEGTRTPTGLCSSTTASPSPGTTTLAIQPIMDSPPETTTLTSQPNVDSPGNLTVTRPQHITEDDPDVWCVAKSGYQFKLPRSMVQHAVANGFGINPWADADGKVPPGDMERENELFAKTFNNGTTKTKKEKKQKKKKTKKELTYNQQRKAKEKRKREKQLEAAKSLNFKRTHPIAYPEYADPGRGPFELSSSTDEIIGGVFRMNNFDSRPWMHAPAADLGKTKITWEILDTFLQNLPEDSQEALLRDVVDIMLPTKEEEAMEERIGRLFEMRRPSSKSGRTKRKEKIITLMERLKGRDREKLEKLTALKDKLVGMMGFISMFAPPTAPIPTSIPFSSDTIQNQTANKPPPPPDPTSLIRPDHARKTACLDRDYNSCVVTQTGHDDKAERNEPPSVFFKDCRWKITDLVAPVYTEAVYIFNPAMIASFDWDTLKRYFPRVYKRLDESPLCQESNIITMGGDLVDDFVNFRRAYLEGICQDTIELLPRVDPEKGKVVAPATRPDLLNLHRTMARINNILERKIPQWRTGGVDEWEEVDDDKKLKDEEVEVDGQKEEEGEREQPYMPGSFEEFIDLQDDEWRENLMAAWVSGGG
ncbi:hypothetical protein GE09DRAFT_1266632 [Coniochaeta sp. 2T2.1]|nr:hypothetical protein GE09DRAFT_1266632 [Coniochaeta sp. 2T2.1]